MPPGLLVPPSKPEISLGVSSLNWTPTFKFVVTPLISWCPKKCDQREDKPGVSDHLAGMPGGISQSPRGRLPKPRTIRSCPLRPPEVDIKHSRKCAEGSKRCLIYTWSGNQVLFVNVIDLRSDVRVIHLTEYCRGEQLQELSAN
jgi:hypothetical protein